MRFNVSRRDFLHAGLAAGTFGALGGCSSEPASRAPSVAAPAAGRPPEPDALRRLQDILRSSPDHLIARSRELVARRSVDDLVAFVRDRIDVLPTPAAGDPLTAARWGAQAALRGGAGTLRERAELLASLLVAAGTKATVVAIDRPAAVDAGALAARRPPAFAPDDAALAALWRQITGGVAPWPAATGDPLDGAAARTAARLLAALPAEAREAAPFSPTLPTRIPSVVVESQGRTRWAIALGSVALVDREPVGLSTSIGAMEVPQVEVRLSVAVLPPRGASTDGAVVHEVARGRWSAADVAGRHVEVTFPPTGVRPVDAIGLPPDAFPLRIPVLRLVRPEGGDTRAGELGESLAMVSRAGGLYTANSGKLTGPYGPVATIVDAERHRRADQVRTLRVDADASTFPAVELRVSALDAAGSPVDGLGAADLVVQDTGRAVPYEVIANGAPAAVRLLVLYDASGSVSETWRTPSAKATFERALARSLTEASATAPFQVQVIALGGSARSDAWAPPTENGVAAALAAVSSTSDVWSTLGRALPASGASAAIMVSDNRSSLEDPAEIPRLQRALSAAGAPVLCVPIGRVDEAATALIVGRTGGERLSPTAPDVSDRLRAFAERQVKRAATASYRLRYRGNAQGPAERTVGVALAAHDAIRASARYHVPSAEERAVASGVGGVYLTITVAGRTATRRLGGVAPDGRGGLAEPIGANAIAEATRVLDGVTAVAFEPGAPPPAVLLDDAVSAAFGARTAAAEVKPTLEAVDRGRLTTALGRAGRYPALLPALLQPSPTTPAAPPEGLRVVVIGFGTDTDGAPAVTTDLVPDLNRSLPVGPDRRTAFAAALRTSVGLSLREAGAMQSSAAALIGERPLQVVAPFAALPDKGPWDAAGRAALRPILTEYIAWYRLVPTTGSVAACWVVDPATGTAVAVGALGRGGGTSHCKTVVPHSLDIATAIYWLGTMGALISIYCASLEGIDTRTVPQNIACVGAQSAGAVSAAGALFTAQGWSAKATTYFVFAVGALFGALPDILGETDPVQAPARVVLAVIALLMGVIGNMECDP